MTGAGVSVTDIATRPRPAGFVEYNPDPGFDDPAGWTSKVRCSVAEGAVVFSGLPSPFCYRADGPAITAGTYEASGVAEALNEFHFLQVFFGGSLSPVISANGPFTVTFSTSGTNQLRGIRSTNSPTGRLLGLSIRKVA